MPYSLTTEDLVNYIQTRLLGSRANLDVSKSADGRAIIIRKIPYGPNIGKEARFVPDFIKGNPDRIELEVELDVGPRDFSNFLRGIVDSDKIFQKPNRLYSPEREKNLQEWRRVMKRVSSGRDVLVCEVVDNDVSTERLRKIFYEYMIRPSLVYLFS